MERMEFRAEFERLLVLRRANAITIGDILTSLQQLRFSDVETVRLQAVAFAIVDHIKNTTTVKPAFYGDVAKEANAFISKIYGQQLKSAQLPTKGHALSNQIGNILGLLSSMSYRAVGIFISSIVVPAGQQLPTNGFFELVFFLTGVFPSPQDVLRYQQDVYAVLR